MSSPAEAMAAIVTSATPFMKARGFRKRRHSFNRTAGDGLVHVVSFQMGAFDPPGTAEIPGLRPNLYGKCTVNLGVFVLAMRRTPAPKSDWVNEYNCQLRKRIGHLLPARSDMWWELRHPDARDDIARAIQLAGLPWLEQFASYGDILRIFEAEGREALGMAPAAPLDIADLYLAIGDRELARRLLADYVTAPHAPQHRPYVTEFLSERGFTELAHASADQQDG